MSGNAKDGKSSLNHKSKQPPHGRIDQRRSPSRSLGDSGSNPFSAISEVKIGDTSDISNQ